MADPDSAKRFIDDEAEKSGSGHTDDEEDDIMTDLDRRFIDDTSQPDDLDLHRALLHRTDSVNLENVLELASRNDHIDLRTAHDDILPDSPTTTTTVRPPSPSLPQLNAYEHQYGPDDAPMPTGGISDFYVDDIISDDLLEVPKEREGPSVEEAAAVLASLADVEPADHTVAPIRKAHGRHRTAFELRHCSVFLTYPQCTMKKESMLQRLVTLLLDHDPKIIVAHEDHKKTEGEHLHVYVQCKTPIVTASERYFDIDNYHPNIRIVKRREGMIKYCCKGGDVVAHNIDVAVYLKDIDTHRSHTANDIAVSITKGATFDDIQKVYPGFAMLHRKVIKETIADEQEKKDEEQRMKKWKTVVSFVAGDGVGFNNMRIAGWLNDHLLHPHVLRGLCLWIKAPTKAGKTTLIEWLRTLGLNILNVDLGSGFYDGISDKTQLIVFDEFKAQKTITEMNKLCDGSLCRLNIKGSSFQLKHPTPVIVLSNFTIKECYHNSDQAHLETLIGRFLELDIPQGEHISINCEVNED